MVKVYQDGAALVALDTAAYDSGKDLVLDGDSFQLTSNVVIKSTVTIKRNVLIDLNGFNITFSRDLFAGEYQIFTGLGNILGKNISVAYSDWVAPAGDGYVLDPLTADDVAKTYKYNGVTIPYGTAPNVTFTDDTAKLQQFLNIKARELIISEGVYMIDPHGNKPYDHVRGGLLYRDMVGATLRVKGVLKNLRGTKVNGNVLRYYNNVGCTIIGNKGLHFQGDLFEHTLAPFDEGGMGIYLAMNFDCKFIDFEINLCTGDSTIVTFPRTYAEANYTSHLYFENVKGNYCRRTGHVIEIGHHIYHNNCTWNGNGLHRNGGLGTWSGVDVEPMGYADVPVRFASELYFTGCTASFNFGGGLRMERVLSGSIIGCEVKNNGRGLEILQVGRGNKNNTSPNDRLYYSNRMIISDNFIEDNGDGVVSNILMPSEIMLSNNSFQNNGTDLVGRFMRSYFKDNVFRGTTKRWMDLLEAKDVTISGNQIIDLQAINNEFSSKVNINTYNEFGGVHSYTIVNGGSGYNPLDVQVVLDSGGVGTGAVGVAKLDANGTIIDMVSHATGGGYFADPTVTITSSTGSGAIIEAHYRPSIDNLTVKDNEFILTIPPNGIARGIKCPIDFVRVASDIRNFKWFDNYVDPRHYQKRVIDTVNTKSSLVRNFQADLMRPQKLMKHDIVHSDNYNFGRAYIVAEGSLPYGRDFKPNHNYKIGDIIKTPAGKMYWCKTAGLSSSIEPNAESGDITNGTAVFIFKDKMFTARAINYI